MVISKTLTINLIKKYIAKLKRNNIPVEKVVLSGSFIKGAQREDSDISFVSKKREKNSRFFKFTYSPPGRV